MKRKEGRKEVKKEKKKRKKEERGGAIFSAPEMAKGMMGRAHVTIKEFSDAQTSGEECIPGCDKLGSQHPVLVMRQLPSQAQVPGKRTSVGSTQTQN